MNPSEEVKFAPPICYDCGESYSLQWHTDSETWLGLAKATHDQTLCLECAMGRDSGLSLAKLDYLAYWFSDGRKDVLIDRIPQLGSELAGLASTDRSRKLDGAAAL